MAGLFGVETPEEVRSRIGATGREQDLQLAQLAPGRVGVATASQQGRAITGGIGNVLGLDPVSQQKKKTAGISEAINAGAKQMGITREKNPIEHLMLSSQVLAQNGEMQAAGNALKMATQLESLSKLTPTALESKVRSMFGEENKNKPLSTKAANFMKRLAIFESTPSSTLPLPADKGASSTEFKNSLRYVQNSMSDKSPIALTTDDGATDTFTFDDFDDPKNQSAFTLAHAETVRNIKNANKKKGNPPLDTNKLNALAMEKLKNFLTVVGDEGVAGYLKPNKMYFDNDAFTDELLNIETEQALTNAVGIDERK